VILMILAGAAVLAAVVLFVVGFLVGLFALPEASPAVLMYVWDGVILAFLLFWIAGLLADLQRTEILSLDKFLHLPVSLSGAFLINYISSWLNLGMVLFVPPMIGLNLGLVFGVGPSMLLLLPLIATFLLMITALTYQFQGWLAALMANPRRRRTVIVVVTLAFVLITQVPNMVNLYYQPFGKQALNRTMQYEEEKEKLEQEHRSKQISAEQYEQLKTELEDSHKHQVESNGQTLEQIERRVRLFNLVLPPGWLPLGVLGVAEGKALPALLGMLGMALIGGASLWRAYRTTLRLYTGQYTARRKRPVAVAVSVRSGKAPSRFLEKELPWVSEPAAVIGLAGFRSLLRAPEAKMMLLGPVILVLVFGSLFLTRSVDPAEALRPLMAFGAVAMILATLIQVAGNQFGFDRSGFRVFVLSGVPRRDILLGKNLALAPLALGLGLTIIILIQAIYPMRLDFFLAAMPQLLSMYLVYCLLANWLSIFGPMAIAPGALKPANPKLIPVLLQFVFFFLFPMALGPILAPLGVALGFEALGWLAGVPVSLILSLLECAVVVFLYRLLLAGQGRLLQAREQRILETVTSKGE
jgi:hypothetical protein